SQVYPATEVEDIIGELLEEAIEAAEVFNHYAQGKKTLKILPLNVESELQTSGFLLLLGRTQIRIQQTGKTIEAMLTLMRGYQMKTALLHKFAPLVDSFGTVMWKMDDKLLLTKELIVRKLLEEVVRVDAEIE